MEGLAGYYDASSGSDTSKHFWYLPFASINKIRFKYINTILTFSIECKAENLQSKYLSCKRSFCSSSRMGDII